MPKSSRFILWPSKYCLELFDKSSPGEYIFYDDLMNFVEDFFVSEDDEKMIGQHYIFGNVTILKILLRVAKTNR